MKPQPPADNAWASLERGLFILLLLLAGTLGGIWWAYHGRWHRRPLQLTSNPPPAYANMLDPNTAGWESLARLPGVGETRAREIVAYRQQHGPVAFRRPDDLANVRGIGPKTVERIAPFLAFPATAPGSEN